MKNVLLFLCVALTGYGSPPTVLVTIPPEKFLVERIAGDTVQIETLVGPGSDPHTFDPTPREAIKASGATIWFRMGEPAEERVVAAIEQHNPNMRIVDMRQGMPLIGHHCHHHGCQHGEADLHFWLSPPLLRRMATQMASQLGRTFPEHRRTYQDNLRKLLRELNTLDRELRIQLGPFKGQALLVSHAALAYFCREYGLIQIPLELGGKEPTARQLVALVDQLQQEPVHRVILQKQFNPKGAQMVAEQLDIPTCWFDPLAEEVETNLRNLADCIASP